MSLTVKHLNTDASFLLTFRPIQPFPPSPGDQQSEFTILLDPWLAGESKIFHPKFSISRHTTPSCVSSLGELPEPDLVVISQEKSDHCHKQTLTQLPKSGGKTIVLAEPAAAKTIRSWKHFDAQKLVTLNKWEGAGRSGKCDNVHRIPIAPLGPEGLPGEVTVAWLPQKGDLTGLHNAIGITYRPPSQTPQFHLRPLTPPDTPLSSSFSNSVAERALSVIFSPHGCSYKTLAPYVTTHLIHEAALPLTALLHCFDRVTNAWYLGGNICAGFPGGLEIAQKLLAKAWISAHDGDKDSRGFASHKITIEKYDREEVESVVSPRSDKFPFRGETLGTEAVVLNVGEELYLNQAMDLRFSEDDAA